MSERRKRIVYVLLYYKAFDDTVECIDSLTKLKSDDYVISYVVVDNNSNDSSFEKLKKEFQNLNNIYFIETGKNLGFARGNNVGIMYAKEKLKADFVIAMNTDIVIKQADIYTQIVMSFDKEQFYVMGPKVVSYYSNDLQSPIGDARENKPIKRYFENKLRLLLWETNLIQLIRKFRSPDNRIKEGKTGYDKYNCVCSGCCLVFSPLFLDKWDGFYNGTFLYREETILFYILNTLHCKTLYNDKITIFHKGGTSTNTSYGKSERLRSIRYYKTRSQSLIQEMKVKRLPVNALDGLLKVKEDKEDKFFAN